MQAMKGDLTRLSLQALCSGKRKLDAEKEEDWEDSVIHKPGELVLGRSDSLPRPPDETDRRAKFHSAKKLDKFYLEPTQSFARAPAELETTRRACRIRQRRPTFSVILLSQGPGRRI